MPLFRLRQPKPQQKSELCWQDQVVQVTRKAMKSVRLKLHHDGQLRVSCPHQVTDAQLADFLNQRQPWITQQQQQLTNHRQQSETINNARAMHLWGRQLNFELNSSLRQQFEICHQQSKIYLRQLPADESAANSLHQQVWRNELKQHIAVSLPQWQADMDVQVAFWNVKNMRTKWGSCNVTRRRIWLSLQLAQYPKECTEMVLVHELTHLLEAAHNKRFYQLMDKFLPEWRDADAILKNRAVF